MCLSKMSVSKTHVANVTCRPPLFNSMIQFLERWANASAYSDECSVTRAIDSEQLDAIVCVY